MTMARLAGLAPIALFVHDRPDQTRLALDALADNRSVIAGLDALFLSFESLIILQDDLVAAPQFLDFMNEGLRRYAPDVRVGAIQGFDYGAGNGPGRLFFNRFFSPWGWATWRRAWAEFEPDPDPLLRRLENPALRRRFNLDGGFNFYRQLNHPDPGEAGSWHARWYASQFLRGHLALYPGLPLVQNLGLVLAGAHSAAPPLRAYALPYELKAITVAEDPTGDTQIARFFAQGTAPAQTESAGLGRAWERFRALFI